MTKIGFEGRDGLVLVGHAVEDLFVHVMHGVGNIETVFFTEHIQNRVVVVQSNLCLVQFEQGVDLLLVKGLVGGRCKLQGTLTDRNQGFVVAFFVQILAHFVYTIDIQIAVVVVTEHDPGMVGENGKKFSLI